MNAERKSFVEKIGPAAKLACQGSGLFASLLIAQACLESANGKSQLSLKANNYFGIKAIGGWKGACISFNTREVIKGKDVIQKAAFRMYGTLQEGFRDRCDFLKKQPRYSKAGVFTAADPYAQADALQKAGYATDPTYALLLKQIIRLYKLERFDKPDTDPND